MEDFYSRPIGNRTRSRKAVFYKQVHEEIKRDRANRNVDGQCNKVVVLLDDDGGEVEEAEEEEEETTINGLNTRVDYKTAREEEEEPLKLIHREKENEEVGRDRDGDSTSINTCGSRGDAVDMEGVSSSDEGEGEDLEVDKADGDSEAFRNQVSSFNRLKGMELEVQEGRSLEEDLRKKCVKRSREIDEVKRADDDKIGVVERNCPKSEVRGTPTLPIEVSADELIEVSDSEKENEEVERDGDRDSTSINTCGSRGDANAAQTVDMEGVSSSDDSEDEGEDLEVDKADGNSEAFKNQDNELGADRELVNLMVKGMELEVQEGRSLEEDLGKKCVKRNREIEEEKRADDDEIGVVERNCSKSEVRGTPTLPIEVSEDKLIEVSDSDKENEEVEMDITCGSRGVENALQTVDMEGVSSSDDSENEGKDLEVDKADDNSEAFRNQDNDEIGDVERNCPKSEVRGTPTLPIEVSADELIEVSDSENEVEM